MKAMTDTYTLANGVKIPCIGYGTWQTPDGEVTRESVKYAISSGYRLIDTAFAYGNEVSVGEGIRASGVARDELFIATKHWITARGYEKTMAAIDASLKNLGLEYLDQYLIHWPCVKKVADNWEEINASTWRAFEEAYRAGKIRVIGVSNFQEKHITALAKSAEIMPMVNQIEFHPGYTQLETVKWSQKNHILVQGWSPLGSGAVLTDGRLEKIAEKYGKSTAQLCIRFALQNDVVPLPKSVTPSRILDNSKVFDFDIDEKDMSAISAITDLGFSGFMPEEAPADALVG